MSSVLLNHQLVAPYFTNQMTYTFTNQMNLNQRLLKLATLKRLTLSSDIFICIQE